MQQVLTHEFVAKERHAVVIEAIDGLQAIQRQRQLTFTESASLKFLEQLVARVARCRNATITAESIRRPVAVAQAAMQRELERAACAW